MTASSSSTSTTMWVAIDVSKARHDVLVEFPDGHRRGFRLANTLEDFAKLPGTGIRRQSPRAETED